MFCKYFRRNLDKIEEGTKKNRVTVVRFVAFTLSQPTCSF